MIYLIHLSQASNILQLISKYTQKQQKNQPKKVAKAYIHFIIYNYINLKNKYVINILY